MITTSERMNIITKIIGEVLEIEPSDISPNSRFVEDLGADSLRAIEIMSRLEKKFGVQIPQNDLPRMTDLAGVYSVLRSHAAWEE